MLQYQAAQLDRKDHVQQVLEEEQVVLQAGLSLIPSFNMDALQKQLQQLQAGFSKVADQDLDAMMSKASSAPSVVDRQQLLQRCHMAVAATCAAVPSTVRPHHG